MAARGAGPNSFVPRALCDGEANDMNENLMVVTHAGTSIGRDEGLRDYARWEYGHREAARWLTASARRHGNSRHLWRRLLRKLTIRTPLRSPAVVATELIRP